MEGQYWNKDRGIVMSELETFNKLVDDIWEMVFGTERRPKPKRARSKDGRYRGDDKTTPDINEAWVGGKAPKKRRKK